MQGTSLELFRREVACACIGYMFSLVVHTIFYACLLCLVKIFSDIYRGGGGGGGQIMTENMIEEKQQMTLKVIGCGTISVTSVHLQRIQMHFDHTKEQMH